MTSLTGTTERCAPQRSPKCVVADSRTCYTGDSWYGTAGGEGGGSLPGSSGSPSPGSGISSPGSYGGSPASETRAGICTGSPGSLGGSPGFGTGSPGVWCENCNARLVELKRQALQLLIPGTFSSKDPSFPAMLNDKLQVPDSTRKAWNERDARCEVCATHISQLKQEAVYMVLSLEQAASLEPGPPPSIPSLPALVGSRNIQPGPRDRGSFAKHVSPGSAGKPGTGCNTTVAPSILSSVALQAHHYLESSWSVSRTNGVTLYPCQNLQAPPLLPEASRDGPNEAAESCAKAERASQRPPQAPTASAQSSMTSAAASFFARAAQKLNLNSKRKKVRLLPAQPAEARVPHPFPTNYCSILHTTPPPAPPCLLRSLSKVKDTPGLGKVKVMLRVSPLGTVEPHSFLKVDPRKKQVTITDLAATAPQGACRFQKRGGNSRAPPKTFFFDAVFPHDTSQAEVCAGSVAEVIQCVVNGADGCIFCFGQAKLGKSYTMIGKDDSMQTLGIIPCAISWLFKLIGERKDKMGTRFSIRVSAVEVSGRDEVLKDLLSEVATGSLQDGQSPAIHLCEDPVCGTQLHNQSELRAPTAEKAAYYLDAAIAARIKTDPDSDEEEQCNSHMLFTLHVYQYRAEKTGKLGMSGGRSRLHLIDLGSCVKVLSKTRDGSAGLCLSLSALGNVILALVNGSKHIPYKESKLTMLLRESLGNINCRTTMIAHISPSPSHFSETLSTIQIASRILRMKKKKTKQHTSSSSGGESSCEEGRMRRPTHLRAFHSQRLNDPDMTLIHVSSDPDEHSSSEQSCDTVIYVGPNGSTLSDRELTDNEGPPECLPIMSSLKSMVDKEQTIQTSHGLQPEHKLQDSNSSPKDKPEVDWFKCNTFAQLQERLGCIDGSEEVNIFPFEEHLDSRNPKESMATTVQDASDKNQEVQNGKDTCCDQQLMDIQELVAEAVMTQSMIQSLSYSVANSSNLSTGRYVMGGNTVPGTYTQKKMSTDVLCNIESTSTGHIDSKPRTTGSPRLGIASLTKTSDYKLMSSSQRCKVYTQMGIMPTITYMSTGCLTKEIENSSAEFLLQKEKRTSPIGMGSQVLTRSSSCSSLCSSHRENEHQPATPSRTAVSCCSTLTVQQMGVDDQVSVKELKEITIRGITEDEGSTSELSFDSHCSVQALASRSRPVSSVSSISENKNGFHIYSYNNPHANSEISFSQFRLLSAEEDQPDKCSSISSWLNQMSISTNGRKPFCTFSVQEENLKLNDKKTTESEPSTTVKCIISNVQACGEPKSTLRTNITFHSCSSPEIMQDVLQASPSKRKVPIPICSKNKFDDPWLIKYNDDIKHSEHTDGVNSDCQNRVVDGCEISMNVPKSLNDTVKGGSLPRICHHLESSHYYTGEHRGLLATSSTPCSPRSTLDRQESSEKDKGMPHVPPTRKSRQDQRSPTCGNTVPSQTLPRLRGTLDDSANGKLKRSSVESSRLFRAKLEQLANRTNSLGRNPGIHYDFLSLGRTSSLSSGDSKESLGKDSSGTKCSPTRTSLSPCNGPVTNKTLHSPKMSGVSKILMGSPKAHSLAASSTKTLSFSTKSLQQSVNRNSSLPPNGNNLMDSWSTQSLSRSRGSGLAARLPLKAVNSRISELLQGSGGSCSSRTQQRHNFGTRAVPEAHILPSPYSKITAPRRPQRCSIGQASDNSSVLSGELPPAMGKTTVFYHSGGSSGYESMMRDSEATCSTSSAQDSMSDNNSSNNGRRGFRSQRKRSNTGSQRRRIIPTLFLETSSPTKKPINGVRWVESPLRLPQRSLTDSLEIKVYEIDDVERLQRRWGIETKEVVRFSAKMMILDHRQQRISEVQARYDWLKRELAQTKQHLMLSAEKCAPEFDLQQTVEVDSLEYLEALEVVTGQLENCVDFYKAHLMMITCFDVTS